MPFYLVINFGADPEAFLILSKPVSNPIF